MVTTNFVNEMEKKCHIFVILKFPIFSFIIRRNYNKFRVEKHFEPHIKNIKKRRL